jgi:hypothetical protein
MIIANRLSDGRVVFIDSEGQWVESIQSGALVESETAAALLEQAKRDEAGNRVIDPNIIDVVESAEQRRPAAVREAIRAFGPTVRTDQLGA